MEDYRLEQSGQEVQDILNGAAMQTDLTAENERAELAEQTLQGNIDAEETRAKAAEKQNADDIDAIEEKIPSGASAQNKLVDHQTMNSSIATATATYRGAYNLVSDLGLTVSSTEQQIAEALATKMTALSITPDNNDYCYVQVPTSDATPTQIARVDRYKYNGTAWGFEYSLNNSGFTAAQWNALNSGITSGLVTKLSDLPTYTELMTLFDGKQNTLTFDSTPTAGSNNPVTSNGIQQSIGTIEEKIPSGASAQNKLVDQQTMNSSIATATATYRGAYNLVSDLSLTVSATEQQIAAALATKMTALSITPDNNDYCYVQVPTSDATPTQIARVDRYKFNGTAWGFEYSLNNSGFTAAQWDALNSGITSGLVAKLSDLPSLSELTALLAGKQNTLTFDSTPTSGSSNPVTSNGIKQAIDAHTVVTDATPTAGSTNPVQSGGVKTYVDNKTDAQDTVIANAIAAQDDEIDRRMDQQDAEIDSRMDQQDAVISTLNGQDVIVTPSIPSSGVANKIYRVYGTTSYSDYMFNADALTTPIKIAEYSYPGVDNTPTKDSQKLISSGGVYDNTKELFEEYEDIPFSIEGYYLDVNGQETSWWNGACTDFFPVSKGDEFVLNLSSIVQARVFVYDADKQNAVALYTGAASDVVIPICRNDYKYIRVSSALDTTKSFVKKNKSLYSKQVENISEVIKEEYDGFETGAISGKFININGGISEGTGIYKEFTVYKGTKITIFSGNYHNKSTVIGKKITSNTFEPLVLGSQISAYPYEYVCEENMVVGISFYYGGIIEIKFVTNYGKGAALSISDLEDYNANKEQETLIQDVDFGFMFNSIGVIGDSLSCGTIEYGAGSDWGSFLGFSWPAHLYKRWNSAIYRNYAHAGQTTANWISEVLPIFQADEQICDIYFIALGTNNEYDESNPSGDQQNYDAFISRYNSIIDAVRTKAPHAAIMLVSLFQKRNGNAALESIAATRMATDKGIYYIDYANNAKYERYSPEVNLKGHFSTTGYVYVASVINQVLNNVIWNNQTEDFWKEFAVYHSGQ